jgi:hypothetical protein
MRIVPALICAATIGFASHANAQQMVSAQAGPTAELIARGAAVVVPVSFSCAVATHNFSISV